MPCIISTASATSSALPIMRPSGSSMGVIMATTFMPRPLPVSTSERASVRASSMFFINAPRPTLTSMTSAEIPCRRRRRRGGIGVIVGKGEDGLGERKSEWLTSAAFLEMIEPVISGTLSTVPDLGNGGRLKPEQALREIGCASKQTGHIADAVENAVCGDECLKHKVMSAR